MSLEKTKKDLYQDKSKIENRGYTKSEFDLDSSLEKENKDKYTSIKNDWEKKKTFGIDASKRKALIIGALAGGIIIMVALAIFVVNRISKSAFSEERVKISIVGDDKINSAQEAKFIIKYENNNRVSLNDAEIIIEHSENFRPAKNEQVIQFTDKKSRVKLGKIKAHSEGEIELAGKFYAPENYTVYMKTTFRYKPSNFNSFFQSDAQTSVVVKTSPIDLRIVAPAEAFDGSMAEYSIYCENNGQTDFSNLILELDYPKGFEFRGADPYPISGDKIWRIENLRAGEKREIKLSGELTGKEFDTRVMLAMIFTENGDNKKILYNQTDEVTKIVSSPLNIKHTINDKTSLSVNLGSQLKYKIVYRNKGQVGLRDIIVRLKVDSPVLDLSRLNLASGAYDSQKKIITWRAGDIPQLKNLNPGESGQIIFSIPVKKKIEITDDENKNFTIESVASIDSSDIAYHSMGVSQAVSDKIVAKLNSKIILESKVFYNDTEIKNSGPIPPQVGKETTYTIHWLVSNVSNDISNTIVRTHLPSGVKWKNKFLPADEKVKFNERTNELVWEIGNLKNGIGILNYPKEISFQIGATPAENNVGKELILTRDIILTARDVFTDERLSRLVKPITTILTADSGLTNRDYQVVP